MILVDTSIWIDHLHTSDPTLIRHLEEGLVLAHPLIIGEISLGSIRNREVVLALLTNLPTSVVADHHEVATLIESSALAGRGLNLVDVHLLAAVRLTPDAQLWTRDRRLRDEARTMNIAAAP